MYPSVPEVEIRFLHGATWSEMGIRPQLKTSGGRWTRSIAKMGKRGDTSNRPYPSIRSKREEQDKEKEQKTSEKTQKADVPEQDRTAENRSILGVSECAYDDKRPRASEYRDSTGSRVGQ